MLEYIVGFLLRAV